jgi:hypothetical protein
VELLHYFSVSAEHPEQFGLPWIPEVADEQLARSAIDVFTKSCDFSVFENVSSSVIAAEKEQNSKAELAAANVREQMDKHTKLLYRKCAAKAIKRREFTLYWNRMNGSGEHQRKRSNRTGPFFCSFRLSRSVDCKHPIRPFVVHDPLFRCDGVLVKPHNRQSVQVALGRFFMTIGPSVVFRGDIMQTRQITDHMIEIHTQRTLVLARSAQLWAAAAVTRHRRPGCFAALTGGPDVDFRVRARAQSVRLPLVE